jgi:hypothetical protein
MVERAYIEKLGTERHRAEAVRHGAVGDGRSPGNPGDQGTDPGRFEVRAIVAAARELAGQRVCFVGVGPLN